MKLLLTFSILIISKFITAQPSIIWQKSYGGSASDVAYSIRQTTDSGYIFTGYTESNDTDVTGNHGNRDYWVAKTNSVGTLQWQKTYGGTDKDMPGCIEQTTDGGFIVGGYSLSDDGDANGNHGQEDYWIVKINASGIIQWQKSLGGSNVDRAYSIKQTDDGGYIIAGSSNSIDGNISQHHVTVGLQNDFWIVRLDSVGTLLWEKSLGGSQADVAYSVHQTTDGGFIVAGNTNSIDGDVTGLHGTISYADIWVVKLSATGIIQWQKTYGGTDNDFANTIKQTNDGGYVISGNSSSSDGDVTLHWGSFIDYDCWIVKLDSAGAISWQKTIGGTSADNSECIIQTNDGGFVIAGYTNSNDGDLTGLHGLNFDYDYWIIKLNNTGTIEWQKLIGGTANDVPRSIISTADNAFMVAGSTSSNNGDVTVNYGSGDFWIVKLGSSSSVFEIPFISDFQLNPNPFSDKIKISFTSILKNTVSKIYDANGKLIKELRQQEVNGKTEIIWDATDNTGKQVSNGIYYIRIFSDKTMENRKIILQKN